MKLSVNVEVAPFEIPTSVRVEAGVVPRENGFTKHVEFSTSKLDVDTLVFMCQKLVRGIFSSAGKAMPKEVSNFVNSNHSDTKPSDSSPTKDSFPWDQDDVNSEYGFPVGYGTPLADNDTRD